MPGMDAHMSIGLENILKARLSGPNPFWPACVVLDVLLRDWTAEIFQKFNIPMVGFFTSGAGSAAMEYATWKAQSVVVGPGEVQLLRGLPDDVGSPCPFKGHLPPDPPPPDPEGHDGPHVPWIGNIEGSIKIMINTCEDLEGSFIEYLSYQFQKHVWAVGPLLPQQYWKSSGHVIQDHKIRNNNQLSNVTEDAVIRWLDGKPCRSVLYVAFGTVVGPNVDESVQLADALAASTRPFIWAIQHGSGRSGPSDPGLPQEAFYPHGLEAKVGLRGLIIHGWAPQLLILSHLSTGGFLSHCGWNSTNEAFGRGVPILAWPIRGDQLNNAKLLTSYLRIGFTLSDGSSENITKDDILKGIEMLMGEDRDNIRKRALEIATKFEDGFPLTSIASLDAFIDFVNHIQA